jgi:hypothetical protein
VLAKYSLDNQWYRGRIIHVMESIDGIFENTNVEIFYIDYGNTEVVNVQRFVSLYLFILIKLLINMFTIRNGWLIVINDLHSIDHVNIHFEQ